MEGFCGSAAAALPGLQLASWQGSAAELQTFRSFLSLSLILMLNHFGLFRPNRHGCASAIAAILPMLFLLQCTSAAFQVGFFSTPLHHSRPRHRLT
jgi:hypothetical protein